MNWQAVFDGPVTAVATDESLLKGSAAPRGTPIASVPGRHLPRGLDRFHPSELISALQKSIRRGKVGDACAIARALLSRSGRPR